MPASRGELGDSAGQKLSFPVLLPSFLGAHIIKIQRKGMRHSQKWHLKQEIKKIGQNKFFYSYMRSFFKPCLFKFFLVCVV